MPNWTGNVAILNFLSPSKSAISFTISLININKNANIVGGKIIFKLFVPFKWMAVIKNTIARFNATDKLPNNGIRFNSGV